MGQVITIPYAPREAFRAFHDSKKRYSVLCCHRGAGKTHATVNHLIRAACLKSKSQYAFISPTFVQGKRTAWTPLKDYVQPIPGMKLNETELKAEFPNGSIVYILGSENSQSLRGLHLDGVVFDEYALQPPNIYGEIILPALAVKHGFCVWIGTVVGKENLYKLYDEHKSDPAWYTLYLRASESGIISPEELENAKLLMTPEEYAQEYELEPAAAIRGAIYADLIRWSREQGRVTKVDPDPYLPVDTYWDLGYDDATAIIFLQQLGEERRIIDSYTMTGETLEHYADVLCKREYNYGTHWLPHDAYARHLTSGRSSLDILRGFLPNQDFRVVPRVSMKKGGEVQEGINAVRHLWKTLWFDESRCTMLLTSLEQYRREWDEDLRVFRPTPLHDWTSHFADALRYLAVASKVSKTEEQPTASQPLDPVDFRDREPDLIEW